jgi:hypothetical protein
VAAVLSLSEIFPWRFLLTIIILMGFVSLIKLHGGSPELKAVLSLWRGLVLSWLLHHILIVKKGVLGHGDAFFLYPWHNTPWIIFGMITVALIVEIIVAIVESKGTAFQAYCRFKPVTLIRICRWGGVVSCFLIIAMSGRLFSLRANAPLNKDNLYGVRYRAALWVAENMPSDEIYASWNAGQLGFFSDRTIINLDGLVNSAYYYSRVLHGPVTLESYLRKNQVRYIVDYTFGNRIYRQLIPNKSGELPVDLETKHIFPQTLGGEVIRVWELLPE